jgi:hypothetical protein
MQAKISVALSGKDASKLLEGLAKDPQLRADNDPSVLVEEQFPSEHHAMLQGKTEGSSSDNIITILQWEKHHTPHLAEEQKVMLAEQKNKTKKLFQFTATNHNQPVGRCAVHVLEAQGHQHGTQCSENSSEGEPRNGCE